MKKKSFIKKKKELLRDMLWKKGKKLCSKRERNLFEKNLKNIFFQKNLSQVKLNT